MTKSKLYISLTISILLFIACGFKPENQNIKADKEITGKVVHIVDGDTYDLLTSKNQKIRVRLEGIDAPERGMPYYKVSKNYLGQLCMNQKIKFIQTGIDRYKRALGFSYLPNNREIGAEMLQAGMAWHYKRYNQNPALSNLEKEARKARRGLWQDINPTPPWEKRKQQRNGVTK